MKQKNGNREAIKQAYESGLRQTEIAEKFGICQATVSCALRSMGVKLRPTKQIDYKEVIMLYRDGMEQGEIANKLNVSKETIAKIIRSEFSKDEIKRRRYNLIASKMKGNKRGEGNLKSEYAMKVYRDRWGENNPNWKGDKAVDYSGHARAQRKFDMTGKICERCGLQAQVRHHKDEDPKNNPDDASNIEFLCRSCHAKHHLG